MAALQLLSRLLVADNLHAQLHNGMAIVKMILEPHWFVASLVVIKVTLLQLDASGKKRTDTTTSTSSVAH